MRDPEKVKKEMEEKDRKILETAFRIFVEKKIEPVSMGEIAKEAGVGRATVFRHYQKKLELVIAVCTNWMRKDRFPPSLMFLRLNDLSLRWTVILTCIRIIKIFCGIMTILITM